MCARALLSTCTAFGNPFRLLLESLEGYFRAAGATFDSVFCWLDIFAINQHDPGVDLDEGSTLAVRGDRTATPAPALLHFASASHAEAVRTRCASRRRSSWRSRRSSSWTGRSSLQTALLPGPFPSRASGVSTRLARTRSPPTVVGDRSVVARSDGP